jgi:hypothetical protein
VVGLCRRRSDWWIKRQDISGDCLEEWFRKSSEIEDHRGRPHQEDVCDASFVPGESVKQNDWARSIVDKFNRRYASQLDVAHPSTINQLRGEVPAWWIDRRSIVGDTLEKWLANVAAAEDRIRAERRAWYFANAPKKMKKMPEFKETPTNPPYPYVIKWRGREIKRKPSSSSDSTGGS